LERSFAKIFLFAFFLIALSESIFPQHNQDNDDRKTPIIIDKTHELLNELKERLNYLDTEYLTQLYQKEYTRAKKDLNKIYHLIEDLENQQVVQVEPPIAAMPEPDYRQLVNSISNESFEDNKLAVLQASAKYNYFSVDQIIGLLDLSTFSSWKLKALEITYPFAVDKYNSFRIINAFTFSEDKQKAQSIIDRD
jgi:hypothetical protein